MNTVGTGDGSLTQPVCAWLDIVPVRVRIKDREVTTYALLDTSSDKTFCERTLIDKFEIPIDGEPVQLKLGSINGSKDISTFKISLSVLPLDGNEEYSLLEVTLLEDIPVASKHILKFSAHSRPEYLRDAYLPQIEDNSVTLLIGINNYLVHRCMESRFSPDPGYPDAVKTPFGWLLRGGSFRSDPSGSSFLLQGSEQFTQLNRLDDLIVSDEGETYPMRSGDLGDVESFLQWIQTHREAMKFELKFSAEDVIAYDLMQKRVEHKDGHYQLPLLWRNSAVVLPDNLKMAQRRMCRLERRLLSDTTLLERYTEQMKVLLDKGYAERVPEDGVHDIGPKWYLPHHPVINPRKPDKLRIVFDCAAKFNGNSINDRLMKGPDLMNSLVGVLMRFRKEAVALVADIEAMFHQVSVAPQDRDAFRFLWWPEGDVREDPMPYRMTVHLFGAKSSPSCATFCLRETAREFGKYFDPRVSEVVRKNFYVDDCLTSVSTEEMGCKMIKDLRDLLAMGGFKLTKWLSLREVVMNSVPSDERSKSIQNVPLGGEVQERVLGINWCLPEDVFRFTVVLPDKPITRRDMLSVTNSLFDPLGFVAPVTLEARLIYRDVCQQKLGWDDVIPRAEQSRWQKWRESLGALSDVKLPRFYMINSYASGKQLHFFADASMAARGCVCYLRTVDDSGNVTCTFLMGKSLLSGPGKHTIPRLELEAALDAVRMSRMVKQELNFENCTCLFWTDSAIVLQSLHADSKNFPVFSRNRIAQILNHTSVHDWMHVPTDQNPADQASRGSTARALCKEIGSQVPSFL